MRVRLKNSERLGKLDSLFQPLSEERHTELSVLINNYLCMFNDIPTRTHLIEHDIDVGGQSARVFIECLRKNGR